jgi:hypothetical protein
VAQVIWTGPASFAVPGAIAPQVPAPGTPPLTVVAATPATPAVATPAAPGAAAVPLVAAPVHVPALHAQYTLVSGGGGGGGGIGGTIGAIGSAALSYIPIIGPILGAIFGGLFGGTDLSQITRQLNQLTQQLAQLGDNITRFTWKVAFGLGELTHAIAEIWDNHLDALWQAVKRNWKLLWCEVSQVIPKIISILKDWRKWMDWIYKHIIQPMQKWMQRARAVLALLKALHVPFAAKLDKILTQIQAAVFLPMSWVLGTLGVYGSWFNAILTWDYTLQRPIFLRTMYKYQGDWTNLWWSTQFRPATLAPGATPLAVATPCTVAECAQTALAMTTAGASAFPPEVQAAAGEAMAWVQTGV